MQPLTARTGSRAVVRLRSSHTPLLHDPSALPHPHHVAAPCLRLGRQHHQQRRTAPPQHARDHSTPSSTSTTPTPPQARPSFAPKPVLDTRHIAQNPGLYEQNCIDRNYGGHARHAWTIADLRAQKAQLQRDAIETRSKAKALERQIASLKAGPDPQNGDAEAADAQVAALVADATALRATLADTDARDAALESQILDLALSLPNLSSSHTPVGSTPTQLDIDAPAPSVIAKRTSHVDIGTRLDLLDFAGAAATSGWGWCILRNEAAQLEQALVSFALARLKQAGWTLTAPPSIVHAHAARATGFQPRADAVAADSQTYALAGAPARVLAATAEIPLAAMHAGRELDAGALPVRTAGASRCFRAEAGARGAGTRGLYRVHEFTKVEMFAWTAPEPAAGSGSGRHFAAATEDAAAAAAQDALLLEMVAFQRSLLRELGLPHRVLEMPTADLGASATRKIDIEAFFPGRQQPHAHADADDADADLTGWGEVTSASTCGSYQSRRLGVRARTAAGPGGLGWAGSVNGTALAVPRVLAALLEVGFEEGTGAVRVPGCLGPWMEGVRVIGGRDG